ncbi:MAG: glycosyltransferase [Actinomycetia bacterium]|nr:glycosyltransferase [Actinomycetes bacterium]
MVHRPLDGPEAIAPTVDIVIPVFNEEAGLERSVRRLHEYLSDSFPFTWRITIVDNGSTDGTWFAAVRSTRELEHVFAIHLDEKGRGRALRTAWRASDAAVVAYMDVDLSTDLDALLPLVAPLVSGHSDVAIGSRLAPGASVARHPKREVISRTYNVILRTAFATRVRDAQCGFKALRSDVARSLLPAIEDNSWFFDTELLLLAEHNRLRIHEVAVDWIDDTDTRVRIARTAIDDLKGTARMVRRFATGGGRIDLGSSARPPLEDDFGRWIVPFASIGAFSTAASLGLFLSTRHRLGPIGANAFALSATFVGNTWANARFTTRARQPDWTGAFAIYAGAITTTSLALAAVDALGGGEVAQVTALATTWSAATLARVLFVRRAPVPRARAAVAPEPAP